MKIILDLDEEIIDSLNSYALHTDSTAGEVITLLFKKYLLDPNAILEKNDKSLTDHFAQTITEYLNEATFDIEALSKSNEKSLDDKPMIDVFKTLNRDVIANPYVFSTLLNTYKKHVDK